jgi:hypothetical protein
MNGRMVQWKRAGPIIQRSVDQNSANSIFFIKNPMVFCWPLFEINCTLLIVRSIMVGYAAAGRAAAGRDAAGHDTAGHKYHRIFDKKMELAEF